MVSTIPLIKIAMADDHVMLREALCALINSWSPYKVIFQVNNGRHFIEQMQINPKNLPDIALIDLEMPEMNGYETIYIAKKKYPPIKFIAISAYSSEESIVRLLKVGADGFIFKGEHPNKLKMALFDIINNGYYFSGQPTLKLIRSLAKTRNISLKNDLSEKELLFLNYLITEQTYKEIADNMKISPRQVEYLRNSLFERFDVQSRTALAVKVIKKGLVI